MAPSSTTPALELAPVDGLAYGVRVTGLLPTAFADHLWPAPGRSVGAAGARTLAVAYRPLAALPEAPYTWQSEPGDRTTPGRFTLAALDDGFRLDAWGEEGGRFTAQGERLEVAWRGEAAGAAHHLFAYALPLWLETRGVPVLHGAAVTLDGRGLAFLAPSGTGKSVLCAQLVARGAGFLADDALAIDRPRAGSGGAGGWWCHPGPPLLRLWPSGLSRGLGLAAEPFPSFRRDGDKRHLPSGHLTDAVPTPPQDGGGAAAPLHHVYLLERRNDVNGGVESTPLRPREVLLRLLEHGVAAGPVAALGQEAKRLERLARLAESVPASTLAIPSGEDALDHVLRHLAAALDPS